MKLICGLFIIIGLLAENYELVFGVTAILIIGALLEKR